MTEGEDQMPSQNQPSGRGERGGLDAERAGAFTPGPWVLWGPTTIAVRPIGRYHQIGDGLATVHQRGDWHANARLISAAPDLLAACQALITACTTAPPVKLLQHIEFCLTQAAEAVEKALGPSAQDTAEQSDRTRDAQP